jgi:hypothetical protein
MRLTSFQGPCRVQGPIIRETESFYIMQSADGERRFRKASIGMLSRRSGVTSHIEPCPRCADYCRSKASA